MAIRVGVTSLLVIIATVVRLLPLDLPALGRFLGLLKRLGRMTGVKVRLGLVNVSRPFDDTDSSAAGLTLDTRVKSVSRSSRLRELDTKPGVIEEELSSTEDERRSVSLELSSSGAAVGWMLEARA